MKVTLTTEGKKTIFVSLMPEVQKMIQNFKEEDSKVSDYAVTAGNIAAGRAVNQWECLKAEASIARNFRVWNQYSDSSEDLDVWMEFYVYNFYYGFYEIGVYLTDLWKADGTVKTTEEIRNNMYIAEFKKQ